MKKDQVFSVNNVIFSYSFNKLFIALLVDSDNGKCRASTFDSIVVGSLHCYLGILLVTGNSHSNRVIV